MPIYKKLRLYAFTVLIGLLLAFCFHFYFVKEFLGLHYPWNTFLFAPSDRFNDWHNSVYSATTMDPYFKNGVAVSAYFPFAYIIFLSGSFFSKEGSLLLYLISSLSLLSLAIGIFWLHQIRPHIKDSFQSYASFALIMLSTWLCYPAIFSLDRGNIDIYVAALSLIYVAVLRTQYRLWGAVALGIAISLKGYPAAFLLLALVDRAYRVILLAAIISLTLTLVSLLYFNGGFVHNLYGFMRGLSTYRELYVVGLGSIQFSADPYNGLRILYMVLTHSELTPSSSRAFLTIYNIVAFFFAFMCVFFILFVPAPRWRRVMAVCLLAALFPNVINDYKLLILLPGLFALLANTHTNSHSMAALLYLALLMLPKHYLHSYGYSISGIISPVILLLLAINVFANRMAWKRSIRLCIRRLGWYCYPLFSSRLMGRMHKSKLMLSLQCKASRLLAL